MEEDFGILIEEEREKRKYRNSEEPRARERPIDIEIEDKIMDGVKECQKLSS